MRKVFLLSVILGLAACAGEEAEAPPEPVPSSVTVATTAAPTTEAPETTAAVTTESPDTTEAADEDGATIEINGLSFGSSVSIDAGETVRVVNNDTLPHTWTSEDGLFDVSLSPDGGRGSFTFEEAGTYSFFCKIHPSMTGAVSVGG